MLEYLDVSEQSAVFSKLVVTIKSNALPHLLVLGCPSLVTSHYGEKRLKS